MNHTHTFMRVTKRNIMKLYEQDPNVVNFDKLLLTRYWQEFDNFSSKRTLLENMMDATPASTITRARRGLHQDGLILYSKEANKRREKHYREMLEEHSNFITRFWKGKK